MVFSATKTTMQTFYSDTIEESYCIKHIDTRLALGVDSDLGVEGCGIRSQTVTRVLTWLLR